MMSQSDLVICKHRKEYSHMTLNVLTGMTGSVIRQHKLQTDRLENNSMKYTVKSLENKDTDEKDVVEEKDADDDLDALLTVCN